MTAAEILDWKQRRPIPAEGESATRVVMVAGGWRGAPATTQDIISRTVVLERWPLLLCFVSQVAPCAFRSSHVVTPTPLSSKIHAYVLSGYYCLCSTASAAPLSSERVVVPSYRVKPRRSRSEGRRARGDVLPDSSLRWCCKATHDHLVPYVASCKYAPLCSARQGARRNNVLWSRDSPSIGCPSLCCLGCTVLPSTGDDADGRRSVESQSEDSPSGSDSRKAGGPGSRRHSSAARDATEGVCRNLLVVATMVVTVVIVVVIAVLMVIAVEV